MLRIPFGPPRRPTARRARAALLGGLALVLGSHAALAVSLDHRWAELRDPQYGGKLAYLRRQVRLQPGRPLVVALGTSRTEMGFAPVVMSVGPVPSRTPGAPAAEPLVFNFGLTGAGPV